MNISDWSSSQIARRLFVDLILTDLEQRDFDFVFDIRESFCGDFEQLAESASVDTWIGRRTLQKKE